MKRHKQVLSVVLVAAGYTTPEVPFSTGAELPKCGDLVHDPDEMCDDGSRNNDQW